MATTQMEQNIEEWTNEFITAYYSSVVYSKRDVSKFYDPDNAIIYRDSLKEKSGIKISEAIDILVPYIGKGDKLMINQFTSVPIKKGFNLTVFGQTTVNEKTSQFIQFFTIEFFENRAAIISDSLMNINSEVAQNDLVEIPRPSHAKQNAFHQKPSSSKSEVPQQQQQNEINNSNNDNNTNTNSNTNNNTTSNTNNDSNSSLPAQQNNKAPKNKKSKNSKFRFTPE